jgi:hypothetical protein
MRRIMAPRTDLAGIRQCDLLFREVRTSESAVIVGAVPSAGGMPTTCRFPPPWTANGMDTCVIVRDRNGQALAYVYFEDEPGRRTAAKLLTRDQARRVAANIAKLPDVLRRVERMRFADRSGTTLPPVRALI